MLGGAGPSRMVRHNLERLVRGAKIALNVFGLLDARETISCKYAV